MLITSPLSLTTLSASALMVLAIIPPMATLGALLAAYSGRNLGPQIESPSYLAYDLSLNLEVLVLLHS